MSTPVNPLDNTFYQTEEGYLNLKTPYFKIEIAAASSSKYIPLPDSIARLIKKIEIMETQEGNCQYAQQVVITMIEGSREPSAQTDEAALLQLYPLGENGQALTNQTGLITDLRFVTGSTGFSSINPNKADKAAALIEQFSGEEKSVEKIVSSINLPVQSPTFLLQEFNKIKLTWGYLDNPLLQRTLKTVIYAWQTEFPEAGQPETVITCLGADAVLNQMAYAKGIPLKDEKASKIVTDFNTETISKELQGLNTKQALEYICDQLKIDHYISDKLEVNPKAPRVIPAGTTIESFFQQVARETHSYYFPFINSLTDKFSVIFVPKQEWDKQIGIPDPNLFAYKQPGSIIKSISIRADFSGFFGAYKANYNSKGNSVTAVSDNGVHVSVQFDGKVEANPDPATSSNSIEVAKLGKAVYGVSTQNSEINPNASNPDYAQATSIRDAFCQKNRLVFMEFNCLGFPKLAPPLTLKISNIGYRYSKEYTINSVTHTLDESGYSCRVTAKTTQAVVSGYDNPNATKGEDAEQKYESQLIQPKSASVLLGKPDPNSIDTFINLVLT